MRTSSTSRKVDGLKSTHDGIDQYELRSAPRSTSRRARPSRTPTRGACFFIRTEQGWQGRQIALNSAAQAASAAARENIHTRAHAAEADRHRAPAVPAKHQRLPQHRAGQQALRTPPTKAPSFYREGGYLADDIDLKDPWGNAFVCAFPPTASGNDFDLASLGADGQLGGSGAAADIPLAD